MSTTDHTIPHPRPVQPRLTAEMGFDTAAELVLDHLTAQVPLALWAVTRVENGRQTFLRTRGTGVYDAVPGTSNPWEESFCVRMAAGAPAVAPDAQALPVYAAAPVNKDTRIGAYGGAVIAEPDGSVFGAICGIDPDIQAREGALAAAGPLLQLLGQLLTVVVALERGQDRCASAALEATLAAERDALTGLLNRRAWDRACHEEETRFVRLADPTVAVVVDLDRLKQVNDTHGHAAGDRYLQRAASALSAAVPVGDVVARLGGDEFGVLLRGCTEQGAVGVVDRIYRALDDADVAGSVGWAPATVHHGFRAALAEADRAMYREKGARRLAVS